MIAYYFTAKSNSVRFNYPIESSENHAKCLDIFLKNLTVIYNARFFCVLKNQKKGLNMSELIIFAYLKTCLIAFCRSFFVRE